MREIKFRAFLPSTKEMIFLPFAALQYFDFEGSYALSFVVDSYKGFWAHEMYERTTKERCTDAVIMQYTGLKDKNGKEIYEGDILYQKYADKQEETGFGELHYEVVFKNGAFGWTGEITKEFYSFDAEPLNDYEVVGNIYEHKHLLEEK